jgi:ribonuclease HI
MSSRKKAGQWYPEQPAKFTKPGLFEAWVAGSDRPVSPDWKGVSAAAWEIRERGEDQPIASKVIASEARSEEYRAFIAAAVGVLEILAPSSTVTLYCRNKPVVDGINGWADDWRNNGWKRAGGGKVQAKEIWQQLLKVRNERSLTTVAVHCRKGDDHRHDDIIDALSERARREGDARSSAALA